MYRLLSLLAICLLFSCSKTDNNSELAGKWKRVEQFINPGNGGYWKETKDMRPVFLELTESGKVRSNHYVYERYSTYLMIGRDSIEFTNATGEKRYHFYSFQEGKLTIQYLCIEGCGDRFVRY